MRRMRATVVLGLLGVAGLATGCGEDEGLRYYLGANGRVPRVAGRYLEGDLPTGGEHYGTRPKPQGMSGRAWQYHSTPQLSAKIDYESVKAWAACYGPHDGFDRGRLQAEAGGHGDRGRARNGGYLLGRIAADDLRA